MNGLYVHFCKRLLGPEKRLPMGCVKLPINLRFVQLLQAGERQLIAQFHATHRKPFFRPQYCAALKCSGSHARAVGPRHDEWDSAVNIHSACLTHDGWRSLPSSLTPSLAQGAKKEGAEERRAKASKYKDKRQINIMTNVNCNATIIAPRLRIQDDCD